MSIKRTIYEFCKNCGQKDAFVRDGVMYWGHKCPKGPTGPSTPPRSIFHWEDSVIFIRNPEDEQTDQSRY